MAEFRIQSASDAKLLLEALNSGVNYHVNCALRLDAEREAAEIRYHNERKEKYSAWSFVLQQVVIEYDKKFKPEKPNEDVHA